MIRNLTAAEPSPALELDGLMDSANPEQFRGALPTVQRLATFRVRSPSVSTPASATSPPATSAPPPS